MVKKADKKKLDRVKQKCYQQNPINFNTYLERALFNLNNFGAIPFITLIFIFYRENNLILEFNLLTLANIVVFQSIRRIKRLSRRPVGSLIRKIAKSLYIHFARETRFSVRASTKVRNLDMQSYVDINSIPKVSSEILYYYFPVFSAIIKSNYQLLQLSSKESDFSFFFRVKKLWTSYFFSSFQ